jgi:hypothetical protein
MTPGQQMRKECDARLRALVSADEQVLAVGTADEFREPQGDLGVQGQWRFLLVTSSTLLFANWAKPDAPHEEITFDEVTRWADGTQYHRYVITLTHPPMTRQEHVPAHRVLWFAWGNAFEIRTRTTTTVRFSHRGTAAAKALRAALEERRIAHHSLVLEEVSREERTRGSQFLLKPAGR